MKNIVKYVLSIAIALTSLMVSAYAMDLPDTSDTAEDSTGEEWTRFLSKENQERLNAPLGAADLIVVGRIVDIIETPDDDFYFTSLKVKIEECIYNNKQKISDTIIVKLIEGKISEAREKRSLHPKYFPQKKGWGSYIIGKNITKCKINKRYLFGLTTIPKDIHFNYTPGMAHDWQSVYDSTEYVKIQKCIGYYEVIHQMRVIDENNYIYKHGKKEHISKVIEKYKKLYKDK